jgi:hypothetical protein
VKRKTIVIVLFTVLTAVLITYFFFGKERRKRQFSWKENFQTNSDQPYGTLFIRKLLETYRPDERFIYNNKSPLADLLNKDSTDLQTDYVFIGNELSLTREDTEELLKFIHSGNDAFIATRFLPYQIMDSIFSAECENELYLNEHETPKVTFNFYHKSLHTAKGYAYVYKPGRAPRNYKWFALQPDVFCDSSRSLVPLGHFEKDAVNFFKLRFGEGNLYVHTNPIAFTNYFIRFPDKVEYASGIFSHLRGKTIIWDEFSKSQFIPSEPESNPLALIMNNASLKYAWWLMLLSVILYTVFTAKRKQRIVPVREEKLNTSLEYIKMVSALHFENGNNRDIALKKMKYFLYFIRAKYGIHSPQLNRDHFKRLAEKSQIALNHIQTIFDEYGRIENNPYSSAGAHQLLNLYNAIDYFYKHCK